MVWLKQIKKFIETIEEIIVLLRSSNKLESFIDY